MSIYILPFLTSFILSIIFTKLVIKLAKKFKILDFPNDKRKIHKKPTPLLGGLAIFGAFLISLIFSWAFGWLDDGVLQNSQILGLIIGSCVLIIGGALDDKYNLKPWQSILFPILSSIIVVASGVTIKYITNPLLAGTGPYGRALFYFDWLDLKLISLGALFSFLWLLGMTYTTKLLDGLDGLVSGIGLIGAIILFLVSLFWDVAQSGTSILCLILAGALTGFLIFNWHPAKIFLGEGGSTLIGFLLAILSIISGGKIATALLIMGIPILDVAWTILRRIFSGQHSYAADRQHLHFKLLSAGFSHRSAVLFLIFLSFIFGSASLFLQSQHKLIALFVLFLIMLTLTIFIIIKNKKVTRNA